MSTGFRPVLLIQLPASVSRKAAQDGPSAWAPASTWKTRKNLWAPGSCLQTGPSLAIEDVGE